MKKITTGIVGKYCKKLSEEYNGLPVFVSENEHSETERFCIHIGNMRAMHATSMEQLCQQLYAIWLGCENFKAIHIEKKKQADIIDCLKGLL